MHRSGNGLPIGTGAPQGVNQAAIIVRIAHGECRFERGAHRPDICGKIYAD
jgi:hypothetical protein